jgi:Ca2+-binding RTX toxin-like protein
MSMIDSFRGSAAFLGANIVSGTAGDDVVRISKPKADLRNPQDLVASLAGLYKVEINGRVSYVSKDDLENMRFELGAGNDRLIVDADVDARITADGGSGNDVLIGGAAADRLTGGSGNDTIDGRGGNDVIHGGAGHDVIRGGAGNDVLHGDAGNDAVFGGPGSDRLYGGPGDDFLIGGGRSWLFAGVLLGARRPDTVDGGSGRDVVDGVKESEPAAELRRVSPWMVGR